MEKQQTYSIKTGETQKNPDETHKKAKGIRKWKHLK